MSGEYRARRDILVSALQSSGFKCVAPEGAYYILSDISHLTDLNDVEFSHWLTSEIGVAPVPGSSFFSEPELGRHLIRFAFCKTDDMLRAAAERLAKVKLSDRLTV
jgi:aminotransferase